jgi:hypothetical protein
MFSFSADWMCALVDGSTKGMNGCRKGISHLRHSPDITVLPRITYSGIFTVDSSKFMLKYYSTMTEEHVTEMSSPFIYEKLNPLYIIASLKLLSYLLT